MKFNWGHCIAVVLVIFASSILVFVYVASKQKNELVTEKYYEKAVAYQQRIDAEKNALNENAEVKYNIKSGQLMLVLGRNMPNANGTFQFYKPDNAAKDFNTSFQVNDTGFYSAVIPQLTHGRWSVNVSWKVDSKAYFYEKKIFIP
ncbi:MAG TPA: FixH family protein [Bacteroidia bacterium]|nr:hypothetical protein [Bacteroidota bacterium]HMY64523.1 FixH family protein [Bacteroidia bacterium]HNF32314.1 FixH family protein [Bacteroidia bacterium]HNG83791.1 FixH family protein [Bacteroidia bacterium]HOM90236.1 FixH family protein [Bacteroidia bacterium]